MLPVTVNVLNVTFAIEDTFCPIDITPVLVSYDTPVPDDSVDLTLALV